MVAFLQQTSALSCRRTGNIAMEMIVADIDNLLFRFANCCAVGADRSVVDRALVLHMVQLSPANPWKIARWVESIGNLLFSDPNIVERGADIRLASWQVFAVFVEVSIITVLIQ